MPKCLDGVRVSIWGSLYFLTSHGNAHHSIQHIQWCSGKHPQDVEGPCDPQSADTSSALRADCFHTHRFPLQEEGNMITACYNSVSKTYGK